MRVHVGADHAAYELKNVIVEYLGELGHDAVDHGPFDYDQEMRTVEDEIEAAMAAFEAAGNGWEFDTSPGKVIYLYFDPARFCKYVRPVRRATLGLTGKAHTKRHLPVAMSALRRNLGVILQTYKTPSSTMPRKP